MVCPRNRVAASLHLLRFGWTNGLAEDAALVCTRVGIFFFFYAVGILQGDAELRWSRCVSLSQTHLICFICRIVALLPLFSELAALSSLDGKAGSRVPRPDTATSKMPAWSFRLSPRKLGGERNEGDRHEAACKLSLGGD
jgi:hypothetical protein